FAHTQCMFLDIYAFMEYVEVAQPHITYPSFLPHTMCKMWMGCFTTDLKISHDLFYAGVPVWFVHNESQIPSDMNV
ncbi:hypothetical protein EDC04DRAFT_2554943, partial [Pisolithus marmoratus]